MARSPENLWLNAFTGLLAFSGVLVAANVAIAVTRPRYPFWTGGIMIGAYIVGTLALICYLGAMRQWPLPLAGDQPPSRDAPLPRPTPSTTHGAGGESELQRIVRPPSATDLDGLGDGQIRVLSASITSLQDLMARLADLGQTPRPSMDYAKVSAQTQSSADRAKAQLHGLAQQVNVRAWPHKEWALRFCDAERKVRQHFEVEQQFDRKKLAGSVTNLLRLLAEQYPSLFTR